MIYRISRMMFGPFTPVSVLAMVGILLGGILVLFVLKFIFA